MGALACRATIFLAIAATLAAVSACEQAKPPPVITSVEPARIPAGVATPLTVRGRNFFGELERTAGGSYTAALDFRVVLPGAQLDLPATFVDPKTLTVMLPPNLATGDYELGVRTPSGRDASFADRLSVAAVRLVIEDAPGGAGTEVDTRELLVDASLGLYAVSRFADDGAFLAGESATWSVNGDAGAVDVAQGQQVTFSATRPGVAVVTASHPVFGDDDTGDLEVIAASCDGAECIDKCHETCTGDCSLECNSSCTCELDCAATPGTCSASCAGQDDCLIDCVDANTCVSDCAGNSSCLINNCATAGNCRATCSGNARCRIDCANTDSCGEFRCVGNARCVLDCKGASGCGFASCGGAQTVCPGGVIVCNRACP